MACFGLSPDFVEQVAQVHYGERTERVGRLMYRFPSRDDASNFVHNIGILNERYTNVLRDGLIEKMRKAGIDVNTDWEEGERVLNNVNLKANSERNGAFSGDSSTNSKSFEGKVHLHRSSLSDSKDVAKLQKNVELSYRSGEKLYIRTKIFQNWFGKWEKNEQLSSKIAIKTAFYNLYRILVQLWLKA